MAHVVPADHARAVGQAVGVPVVRRAQEQGRGVHRARGHHHDVGAEAHRLRTSVGVADLGDDRRDGPPAVIGLQPRDVCAGDQAHVVVLQRGIDADHLGVGLAAHQAREAVHPVTADAHAVAGGHAVRVLRQPHADRQVERVQALLLEVVTELLDPRLVLHRRIAVVGAGGTRGRVLAMPPVHDVEMLGLGVVRLKIGIRDRPRRGDPAMVAELAEVLRTQPEQRRTVELGVAADVVVHLRGELVAVPVEPELRCAVRALDEHRGGVPVVALARQVVPAFEQQDSLAGRSDAVGERAAARPRTDDDHVVMLVVGHNAPSDAPQGGHRPAHGTADAPPDMGDIRR